MTGVVVAVCSSPEHAFSKQLRESIRLLAGLGVEGDTHSGKTAQHRSRVARDPSQPNLRQVHLLHGELFDELRGKGFELNPGDIGENLTTRGIDLLGLPVGAVLEFGGGARVEITGLRNPRGQLHDFLPGLTQAVLDRDEQGNLVRKSGVMGIVLRSGDVRAGDSIEVSLPPEPHRRLERV